MVRSRPSKSEMEAASTSKTENLYPNLPDLGREDKLSPSNLKKQRKSPKGQVKSPARQDLDYSASSASFHSFDGSRASAEGDDHDQSFLSTWSTVPAQDAASDESFSSAYLPASDRSPGQPVVTRPDPRRRIRNNSTEARQGPYTRDGYTAVLHDEKRTDAHYVIGVPNLAIIILAVIVIGLLCLGLLGLGASNEEPLDEPVLSVREKMVLTFSENVNQMRNTFPHQVKKSWAMILANGKAVLKSDEPNQPGILILAGGISSADTIDCMGRKLTKVATLSYGDTNAAVHFDDNYMGYRNSPGDLKLKIDETLRTGFQGGSHVAHFENLNKVPGRAAMMFHAYCDNESAPFKDTIIIFTVIIDGDTEGLSDIELGRKVEDELLEIWEPDMGEDNASALLSRVANSIVYVRPEPQLQTSQCQ